MSNYPISKICPKCGSTEYKKRKAEQLVAFTADRLCKVCETRYTPPTPVWAGIVFILIGLPFLGIGLFSIYVLITNPNPLRIPAVACEGFLGIVGLFSIVQGIRSLIRPGKA